MKFFDYLWGILLTGLVSYMAIFALLSIYESSRPCDDPKPKDKKKIAKLIGTLTLKSTGVAIVVFVVVKYFSAP